MRVVKASLAAALIGSVLAIGAAPTSLASSSDAARPSIEPVRLRENLTGAVDESVTLGANVPVPAGATGIGPGSRILITIPEGTFGCTANWVWTDGAQRYLGSAGHCFLPTEATSTHGADADFDPALASVRICIDNCLAGSLLGATIQGAYIPLGPVVYARQQVDGVGIGNDFGIVEIPENRWDLIRPSMPVFGGPTSVDANSTLKPLCHYGNGRYVGEAFVTKARAGVSLGGNANQWTGRVLINHGDSGSAIQTCTADADGLHGVGAVGLVTHGAALPISQSFSPAPGVTVPAAEVPLGQGFGTTVARSIQMTSQDAAISLAVVLGM